MHETFDASPEMVAATQRHAGVPARQMTSGRFHGDRSYDGIWACASLLHVARGRMPLHVWPQP